MKNVLYPLNVAIQFGKILMKHLDHDFLVSSHNLPNIFMELLRCVLNEALQRREKAFDICGMANG